MLSASPTQQAAFCRRTTIAFGNLLFSKGQGKGAKYVANPYGFSTKETNLKSGLIYFGARYYDPFTGRFVSKDPWPGVKLNPQTFINKYAYVNNNPVNWIDPYGLCTKTEISLPPWMIGMGATTISTPWPINEEVAGVIIRGYVVFQAGKIVIIWATENSDTPTADTPENEEVKVKDLKKLPDSKIKELGGEGYTSGVKGKTGKSKSNLYWNPKTGDVYSLPNNGGPPEFVDTIKPR